MKKLSTKRFFNLTHADQSAIVEKTRGYVSRCSLGRRWFWVAWASSDDLYDGRPSATGYAKSVEEAEDQAKRALATEEKIQEPAGYAANVHRRQCIVERARKGSKARDAGRVEYVYRDWWPDDGGSRNSEALRIVKKTAKRIYVEKRLREWKDDQDQTLCDVQTFTLDRAEFEKHGEARGGQRGSRYTFYDRPYEERADARPLAQCFGALGLSPPVTAKDIARAYREKAKVYHPDHGGDSDKFKLIQQAYEEAMALMDRQTG